MEYERNRSVCDPTSLANVIRSTGGGRHSPVGGHLEGDDLVLVLDVNRAYQPWRVPAARLFEAVDTVDASSGKRRGVLVVDVSPMP